MTGRASRHALVVLLLLGPVLASACLFSKPLELQRSQAVSAAAQTAPQRPVPASLFGINVIGLRFGTPMPDLRIGAWRSFDSTWYRVEPSCGSWALDELDREVEWASNHGVKLLMLLGNPPEWASSQPTTPGWFSGAPNGTTAPPRDMEDWRTYVRTLATRYRGKVEGFELWNEPNNFFRGSAHELVALCREARAVIKQIAPELKVISPAVSLGGLPFLEKFLAAGGGDTFDVLAVHFYVAPGRGDRRPRPPEDMLPKIEAVQEMMKRHAVDKPLWNTETGWAVVNKRPTTAGEGEGFVGTALSDEASSAFVARAYVLTWAAGIERLYWYSWGARGMSLVEPDEHTPKASARAYDEVQRWLVGLTVRSCELGHDKTWLCTAETTTRSPRCIVWRLDRATRPIPEGCPRIRYRNLSGEVRELHGEAIEVGPSPILLEGTDN